MSAGAGVMAATLQMALSVTKKLQARLEVSAVILALIWGGNL